MVLGLHASVLVGDAVGFGLLLLSDRLLSLPALGLGLLPEPRATSGTGPPKKTLSSPIKGFM